MEERRPGQGDRHVDDASRPSDGRLPGPSRLERFAPVHAFYRLVWRDGQDGSKIPFLVGLLVLQLLVVAVLWYLVL